MEINKVNQATHWDLLQTGGGLKVGMDNTHLLGQSSTVIRTVCMLVTMDEDMLQASEGTPLYGIK
eukprot:9172181-Ditylum_brightwellii.AAC.3